MRRTRLTQAMLVGSAAAIGGLIGLATNAASAQQEPWPGPLRWVQDNPWWSMTVLAGVGILLAVGADLRNRGDRTENADELTLAQVADQLAIAVGRQWQDEARLRRLNDPHPLPVAWCPADTDLVEPWDALCVTATGWPGGGPSTDPAGWATGPAELAGAGNDLADRLLKIPTGRLIVLGEPGAGKTVLLIRLVLELLERRHPGGPVPVLIPLAGWNPVDQDLWTWLEARLTVNHPGLAEPAPPQAAASSRARALAERRLLLPILDGFDELPEAIWSRAITRLNDALLPHQGLVLASRTEAYRQAVTPADPAADLPVRLWGTAGVSLRPLAPDDVRAYLRRDAASPVAAARWEPVLDALDTGAPVAQALTTPLLVGLARTVYNPRPGEQLGALPDPAELRDTTRFPTPVAIQAHLFDAFIPAAYRLHPDPARRCPWTPGQAEQWLVFLARHLEQELNSSSDLAWWELRRALSGRRLALIGGLAFGLVSGIAFGLRGGLGSGLVPGLVFGLLGALVTGLGATPARGLGLRPLRRGDLLFGLAFGLIAGLATGLIAGPVAGLMGGLVVALITAHSNALVGLKADLTATAGPQTALARDRSTYLTLGGLVGLGLGLGLGFVFRLVVGLVPGLVSVALAGVVAGYCYAAAHTAWVPFVLVRSWLAVRRRLPLRLMSFLSDAHKQRGVLRQAGAVYQFRHVDLQRRLATRPSGR
jgi:hypothetical protein